MLSKKDYKKIAEVFKKAYTESYKDSYLNYGNFDTNIIGSHIANMQWDLIEYFKKDNPSFNEDTFIKAMEIDFKKLKKELN